MITNRFIEFKDERISNLDNFYMWFLFKKEIFEVKKNLIIRQKYKKKEHDLKSVKFIGNNGYEYKLIRKIYNLKIVYITNEKWSI